MDPLIKSQLLYQLSYAPDGVELGGIRRCVKSQDPAIAYDLRHDQPLQWRHACAYLLADRRA